MVDVEFHNYFVFNIFEMQFYSLCGFGIEAEMDRYYVNVFK